MQQCQDQLDYLIETPSDEELAKRFADRQRELSKLGADGVVRVPRPPQRAKAGHKTRNRKSKHQKKQERMNHNHTKLEPEVIELACEDCEPNIFCKADRGEIYQSAVRALQAEKDAITLLIGPPGTGKTRAAIEAAVEKEWQITIVRPPVPFGASYGLLPGGLDEKIDPWMAGIKDILIDLNISPDSASDPVKGFIEFASFEHLQSRTLYDFIIFDEVQNCNLSEIYIAMTRVGRGSRMAICGDIDQISNHQRRSGLPDLHDMMLATSSMNVVDFTDAKCYRSGLCDDVTSMFSKHRALANEE